MMWGLVIIKDLKIEILLAVIIVKCSNPFLWTFEILPLLSPFPISHSPFQLWLIFTIFNTSYCSPGGSVHCRELHREGVHDWSHSTQTAYYYRQQNHREQLLSQHLLLRLQLTPPWILRYTRCRGHIESCLVGGCGVSRARGREDAERTETWQWSFEEGCAQRCPMHTKPVETKKITQCWEVYYLSQSSM